jgi:hypothetical protein
VLDKTATFKDCHLGEVVAYMDAHEVATERASVAFFTAPASHELGVDIFWAALTALVRTVRLTRTATVAATSTATSIA